MNLMSRKTTRNQAIWWVLACLLVVMPLALRAQEFVPTAFVAWRPDGTMLAIGSGSTVQIVDAVTMQTLNTLTGLNERATELAWSPDGSKLAIINYVDVDIWQEPWNPGAAQRIVNYQYYAYENPPEPSVSVDGIAWSSDGTKIAAAIGGTVDIFDAGTGEPIRLVTGDWDIIPDVAWNGNDRLAIGNLGNVAVIVNPSTGSIINFFFWDFMQPTYGPGIWSIAFSPDGNQMAMGAGNGEIQVWGDTRTTEYITYDARIELKGHTDYVFSVAWNPNGQYIASGSRDGTVRIWDAVTGAEVQVIQVGTNVQVNSVAWSPDGTRLAYGEPGGTVEIVPAPGAPAATATPTPTETPTPSPTPIPVNRIAFESNRFGDYEVFTMLPDGTDVVRLTTNAATDARAGWSPDHTQLAFMSGRDDTMGEIYVMDADGSNVVRLTTNPGVMDSHPDWSPDGTRLAFTRANTIMLMNADGTNVVTLTLGAHPDWSPDGTKIVYWNTTAGNSDIYVINADGTNKVRLTTNAAREDVPQWSPDGTRIAYSREIASGNFDIYTMNANGSGVVHVTATSASDRYPSWSPDGSEIVFTRGNHLYVMNANGTNVQQVTSGTGGNYYPDWR